MGFDVCGRYHRQRVALAKRCRKAQARDRGAHPEVRSHPLAAAFRLVITHTGLGRQGLVAELDPNNSGVLIVNLDGRPTGAGPVLGVDEITRRLEDSDKGCVIM